MTTNTDKTIVNAAQSRPRDLLQSISIRASHGSRIRGQAETAYRTSGDHTMPSCVMVSFSCQIGGECSTLAYLPYKHYNRVLMVCSAAAAAAATSRHCLNNESGQFRCDEVLLRCCCAHTGWRWGLLQDVSSADSTVRASRGRPLERRSAPCAGRPSALHQAVDVLRPPCSAGCDSPLIVAG